MTDLQQLLEVQHHDTLADQLRHRRSALIERAELATATLQRANAEQAAEAVATNRAGLAASQDRLETDITHARDRIKAVESKLYGGTVSSPRDLQALQDEIASLQRRVGLLEDDELAIMEQLEPIEAALAHETAEVTRLTAEIDRLESAVTAAEAEVDVELASNEAKRGASLSGVPPALLAEYEQIRIRSGGIAVAALVGGQCGGCHMRLSSMELDRVKKQPPDAVIHCEECGRLLVR